MIATALAVAAGALISGFVYLGWERQGMVGVGLAVLRTVAFGALALALFNPVHTTRETGGPPIVLLDASLSMGAAGGRWDQARDTARVLTEAGGDLLRFGGGVVSGDSGSALPDRGASGLRNALRSAAGRSGPVVVITDGEIDDAGSLPPTLLDGTEVITLPRDDVTDAALRDVVMPARVLQGDSVVATVVIGTWGSPGDTANIEVFLGEGRIRTQAIRLPPAPGTARRAVSLSASALPIGTHVLRFRLTGSRDEEPRDDERLKVVTVSSQPPIVVLVDPADIEGRFLLRELHGIAQAGVKGYARIGTGRWVDMRTLEPVEEGAVRGDAQNAALVVLRGRREALRPHGRQAVWYWPAGVDPATEFFEGDWYVDGDPPSSPLAGELAAVQWDSIPPLSGIVPVVQEGDGWVGMTGRRGRRGVDRPLLAGEDSSGVRRLTTTSAGLWRWALRGGAAREAYRAFVAAGVDWLLGGNAAHRRSDLTASSEVTRGQPIVFRWLGAVRPDSLVVVVRGGASSGPVTLRFDASGLARQYFPPGIYRWTVPGRRDLRGISAVEDYSSEFPPGVVTLASRPGNGGISVVVRYAREHWWIFGLAILALLGEWGWRQRRGLP